MQREFHTTQRTSEYFSEDELSMQMGSSRGNWRLTIIKELIDNAIDACESDDISPDIQVQVDEEKLIVSDNGPGVPLDVIEKTLDYNTRTSSNEVYMRPTRGQLGNALKCAWAAPYVLAGEKVVHRVESRDEGILISVDYNDIEEAPIIETQRYQLSDVKNGTSIALTWNEQARLEVLERSQFLTLLHNYSILNPHFRLVGEFLGTQQVFDRQNSKNPSKIKWCPPKREPVHWYDSDSFTGLVKAQIRKDQREDTNTTPNRFIRQFKDLTQTTTASEIINASDCGGATLTDLLNDDRKRERLLEEVKNRTTKPEKVAKFLGTAGQNALGARTKLKYRKAINRDEFFVVECWFYEKPPEIEGEVTLTETFALNFSPVFNCPFPRQFELIKDKYLVDESDPIGLFVHIVSPSFDFTDRGKGRINLSLNMAVAIREACDGVLKRWKQHKEKMKREVQATRMSSTKPKQKTIRQAGYEVMEQAYLKASNNNTLPANARQIMYAARPYILSQTGREGFNDDTFTQDILPDFLKDNPELTKNWRVAYDPRGALYEPHTGRSVPGGTNDVNQYIDAWHEPSLEIDWNVTIDLYGAGPSQLNGVLFVEKEGFHELLKQAGILTRYDIGLCSAKGQINTAIRTLIETLAQYDYDIPIFSLHDFDIAGLKIYWTLWHDTNRYQFQKTPNVIDFGLRLQDIEQWGLEPEPVRIDGKDPKKDLRAKGATPDEIDFLVQTYHPEYKKKKWRGERVEINALSSQELVRFVENKLIENGVTKIIPNEDILAQAFCQCNKAERIKPLINDLIKQMSAETESEEIPAQLKQQVKDILASNPNLSWQAAIQQIVKNQHTR